MNSSMPGMVLFEVDTIRSQLWMEKVLHAFGREDAGGGSLYAGSLADHQDFLEQVLNDAAVDSLDKHNNARESWNRINTGIPNDFRDVYRYNFAAMLIATRGAPIRERKAAAEKKRSAVVSAGARRPDGRPW